VNSHLDPACAREVAAAYDDARRTAACDPLAAAAYARLVTESDQLFWRLTSPDRPDRRHRPLAGGRRWGAVLG
jgi:hypothetical protein